MSMEQPPEPHSPGIAARLNWLRAGVLGANDGIVSVAAIVVGVAGATSSLPAILTAGSAGLVGGAVSMALGEYVSVSSQRDSQRALIAKERWELEEFPEQELEELAAHLEAELNIAEDDVVSPWQAAGASALSFVIGAALPMLAILLPPAGLRIPITFVSVLVALVATGATSALIGGSPVTRSIFRVVIGGAIALTATYLIGRLLGTTGIA